MTDDFTHVMSYNKTAQQYLADILGEAMVEHIDSSTPCSWLPFLLGGEEDVQAEDRVQTRVIKNYIFKIYTYDQTYSNGIRFQRRRSSWRQRHRHRRASVQAESRF